VKYFENLEKEGKADNSSRFSPWYDNAGVLGGDDGGDNTAGT
jgi:hypothetical protein